MLIPDTPYPPSWSDDDNVVDGNYPAGEPSNLAEFLQHLKCWKHMLDPFLHPDAEAPFDLGSLMSEFLEGRSEYIREQASTYLESDLYRDQTAVVEACTGILDQHTGISTRLTKAYIRSLSHVAVNDQDASTAKEAFDSIMCDSERAWSLVDIALRCSIGIHFNSRDPLAD